uniref:AAA+ ATPase domain-containing protein n=1 Tax=Oryza rufipogon TaxID=4529 RepID=A0A0E0RII3_ORYRU
MTTLLPKLGELLVGEYKLQKGVKGQIEELEKELASMTTALRKVASVPADQLDEQSKGHESAMNFMGLIHRTTNLFKTLKTNHRIHGIIKGIMDQVKNVSQRRDRYRVDDVAARPTVVDVDPRLEAMYRKATELVGISEPKNELTKRLLEHDRSSNQQSNIVSIVGLGGLGKTTLANALLQELKAKFDCHFFVSVSLNPDINKIFKNIFLQLNEKKYTHIDEAWETKQLIDKIRDFLNNRSYISMVLCVIDDVWKESPCDTIKLVVQDAKIGSKIIVTTRNKVVAEHAGGGIYELKPLSVDDSRHLFYKRIFDSNDDCPADLCGVTEKILKKCGGVPLAIITIACLLASKPRHSQEWEKVNKSISFGLEDSLDVGRMRKILSLSFDDLPFHLKTCMLSLSKYPEDELIRTDVLIWSCCQLKKILLQRIYQMVNKQLEDCSGMDKNHLNHLDKLRLLRFLRLGHYSATKLPESIGKLESLETLDIRGAKKRGIWKISQGIIDMQQIPSGLQMFFMWEFYLEAFPSWINSSMLSCLTALSIRLNLEYLQPDHLDRLAELPCLHFLRLDFRNGPRWMQRNLIINRGPCAFRSLKHFHFYTGSMLPSFRPGAMPHLERLCLRIRTNLVRGDFKYLGLENLQSLRHATIDSCFAVDELVAMKTEAVIREALKDHPNQAAIELLY